MKRLGCFLLVLSIFGALFLLGCEMHDAPIDSTVASQTPAPSASQTEPTTMAETTDPPSTSVPAVTLDPAVYYITEPYSYPEYDPDAAEGYLEKCQVPEATLSHMTTYALLETVLTCPKMPDFMSASQMNVLYVIGTRLNSMEELIGREDLAYVLSVFPIEELEAAWPHAADWCYRKLLMYTQGATYLADAG
jgi:hypothetical protein